MYKGIATVKMYVDKTIYYIQAEPVAHKGRKMKRGREAVIPIDH